MTEDALQTFSLRRNAVRKAKELIEDGKATGNDYTIEPVGDRFAIYWKPNEAAMATAEAEAEAEIVGPPFAEQANPFPDGSLVIARGDGMAGWHPATVLSRCPTDGGAYWRVQFASQTVPTLRQEPDLQIITEERHAALVAEIQAKNGAPPQAPGQKTRTFLNRSVPPAPPAMSRAKATKADVEAHNGILPTRPEITSPTNQHYVPRFKKLEALAAAGDWAGVEAFEVKGKNSYAKMLIRYRDQLLTAHRMQQTKMEAAE